VAELLEQVGPYTVVRLIAHGGMATVYEGHHEALDRAVALKRLELRTNDPTRVQRFIREGRIAAAFDHPNIVTVLDFFEWEGEPFIAMEYLPHGSLRRWIGRLEPLQVYGVVEQVLAALAHAEQHGVAHRDLKPENVLVTSGGGVKIADFGIAKAYSRATSNYTATGVTVGTPAYMAPEQAEGRPVGPYTDLYALGVMTFEMLRGVPPFPGGESPMAVLYRHVHERPPPLSEVDPQIAAWVARLLAKAPEDRPAGAARAWHALEELIVERHGPYWRRDAPLAQATAPRRAPEGPTAVAVTTVVPRRRRRALAAAVAAVAAVTAGVVVLALGEEEAVPGPEPPAPPAPVAGAPWDFNGDGRATVVAGLPGTWGLHGSVTIPHTSRGLAATTPMPGDDFGTAVASADFNGDGRADLAVGAPGRDTGDAERREGTVTVIDGGASGLDDERRATFTGARLEEPFRYARYGAALAAGDLDGDEFDDLAVGAPGARAVQLLFGSANGLTIAGTRTIRYPARRFGSLLALGDVDGDENTDLLEAAWGTAGHAALCRGRRGGPSSCRRMGGELEGGARALAVADVTGDRYDDVVHGAPDAGSGGRVWLWRGGRGGLRERPLVITQERPGVPGDEERGDEFGAAVAARDLDADGFAEIVVGVPGKDDAAGRVVVLRGARNGHAAGGALTYGPNTPGVPGNPRPDMRFGADLSVLDTDADRAQDLAVTAPGLRGALIVMLGADGRFTGSGAARYEVAPRAESPEVVLGS
jgi:tRNA A-37 threonylcarbamoyl transferase component Bud32